MLVPAIDQDFHVSPLLGRGARPIYQANTIADIRLVDSKDAPRRDYIGRLDGRDAQSRTATGLIPTSVVPMSIKAQACHFPRTIADSGSIPSCSPITTPDVAILVSAVPQSS